MRAGQRTPEAWTADVWTVDVRAIVAWTANTVKVGWFAERTASKGGKRTDACRVWEQGLPAEGTVEKVVSGYAA
eukprot:1159134-Pelagomonas_calceolata.AAC.12